MLKYKVYLIWLHINFINMKNTEIEDYMIRYKVRTSIIVVDIYGEVQWSILQAGFIRYKPIMAYK
jgi:hypothetical protein